MSRHLTLRFSNFWRGFNPHTNLFLDIIQQEIGIQDVRITENPRAIVDLEIQSVFMRRRHALRKKADQLFKPGARSGDLALAHVLSDQLPSLTARHSLWFTGENVRPPTGPWDAYLSYDLDDFSGRNHYFPLWMTLLDWHGDAYGNRLGSAVQRKTLISPRATRERRPGFCCTFISNNHPMRSHAIEAISELGRVDVFGPAVGLPVASKLEVAVHYDFVLCFENDDYPGYVTEKAVESWMTGGVPIWWGNDASGSLNSKAILNLKDYSGMKEMVDRVGRMNSDSEEYFAMHAQPLLREEPTLQNAVSALRLAIDC